MSRVKLHNKITIGMPVKYGMVFLQSINKAQG